MFPIKDNIPTERFPLVTVLLIAINVVVFLGFQHPKGFSSVDDKTVVHYGAIPYELTHPDKHCDLVPGGAVACEGQKGVVGKAPKQPPTWVTMFTSMFMHGGFLHIIGNMLFLWIFGNNVEDAMGRPRFVLFYLLGGLAALWGQVLFGPDSTAPTIGASGAIAAVLGGYLLLYPHARVLTLVFIVFFVTVIELPAVFMLVFWFLEQLYFGAANLSNPTGGGGGVAYWAHIGGFAFGLAAIRLFAKRVKEIPSRYPVY
ncbi:MAG: rhomboid family intramembrane serine protease [Actinomycetota bacterium]|nr:rhomboid family intramembrane serine protease [Actinomycetota bacterium]